MAKFDNSKFKPEKVPEEVNKKRYWIVSIPTMILMAIAAFTVIAFAFMYAVTLSNPETIKMYAVIGVATGILAMYIFIYLCNRIIYSFFLRFGPLPLHYELLSNVVTWVMIVCIYLVLTFLPK